MKEYVFYTTIYDKETLRQAIMLLNGENIDFKLDDRSDPSDGRAPLSTYIEVDILILVEDLAKAEKLLEEED